MKKIKRILSMALCGAMLLGYFPAVSFAAEADGLCEHHTVHENCGYVAAVAGTDCGHEHNDNCFTATCAHVHSDCGYVAAVEGVDCNHQHDGTCGYAKAVAEVPCTCQQEVHTGDCAYAPAIPERKCTHIHGECSIVEAKSEVPCGHDCSLDKACGEKVLSCTHVHDESCGYVAAVEGKACEFVCEACAAEEASAAAVAEVKALMDALPALDVVQAMSTEDQKAAYEQTQAAYEAYSKLTADQQLELPDPEEVFKPLFDYFNTLIDANGEIGSGTPDGTPPVLQNITISSTSVTAPGTVEIAIGASDDVSGVEKAQVVFRCAETNRTIRCMAYATYHDSQSNKDVAYADGKLHGTLKVDQYEPEGIYSLYVVDLWDVAGNYGPYSGEKLSEEMKSLTIEVFEAELADSTAPALLDVAIETDSVTAPGQIGVTVEALDDVSGVEKAQVVFRCAETNRTIRCMAYATYHDSQSNKDVAYADGKLHGTLKVDQYEPEGIYSLYVVDLWDVAGNYGPYSGEKLSEEMKSLTIEVFEAELADSTAPALLDVAIETDSVTAPGQIGVTVEALDDVSGVEKAQVVFRCAETNRTIRCMAYATYHDSQSNKDVTYADGKLHGTLKVDQYEPEGIYSLYVVDLWDVAGNYGPYSGEKFPEAIRSLKVSVVNVRAEVITSVSKDTFVEEITKAESDAYIAADYSGDATMPKEAFDAIAGTDKTIDLISEGITWRFEGSDITEETKDIDLKVDIQKVEDDSSASGDAIESELNGNPGVVMKFPENGTLPGKATIQVKVDYAMREYLGSDTGLSVYYYNNQTGELELIASNLKVINDTYVEFPITHCSYYVLTNPNGSNSGSTAQGIAVDKTNFPDENFRTWILEQDYGKDGVLTESELYNVVHIDVSEKNIADLTGIEYFVALQRLFCNDNQLISLDVGKNTALTILDCNSNQLTALDVGSNTELSVLACGNNQLTVLDVSNNKLLASLYCDGNLLTALDVGSNTELGFLVCGDNQLTVLDVSNNKLLASLYCDGNLLTALDVGSNTELSVLACGNNQLTVLDVSNNKLLASLYCHGNLLTVLDLRKNTELEILQCGSNQLTSLDLSNNPVCTDVTANGNSRTIILDSNNAFDLTKLLSFDVSKASKWTGGTVSNGVLTALSRTITYSYQINASKTVTFTLRANNYDPNAGKMEGTWGNLTWKIDEAGTLIISGTGEMVHFMDGWEALSVPPIDGYPWHRYADLIQSVVVEGVTTLAEIAFHGLDNLQSVTLPDSLTSIGGAAFAFCTSLESITIPANVSTIGKEIFIGSTAFKQITFTGKAPSFDSAAFGEITAEAYYPCDNDTWTTEVQQDYGGDITWVGHVFGQWTTEGNTSSRTCTRCGYTEHKVSTDSGNVEIEIPDQPELEVEVDPVLPTEENYILVEKALESTDYDVLKVFDINLKNSNGVHVQPNGTVKVKLPLDWEKDGNYKVYRVNTDKTLTDMNAYRQGSHMVFETDHFSIYVIAEKIDITAPTAKTLTYTGSAQALVNAGSTTSGTMQYSLDGVTYSASVPTATNAGTYTVYYKVEDSQEAAQTVSVTIAKAKITLTAVDKTAAVGAAKPTLSYTVAGLKGSDKLTTKPTLTCNATMSTAGEYEIIVSGGDAGANYEIQRINGKLSVKSEHKVNVAAVTNGTVSVSHEKAIEGTEIVITATPKSGYHFSTLTVKDAAGTSYVVSTDNNGKYYFIMPDVDVTVTVSFSKNVTADPTNPKTGDEFAVVLWSGIMMTSLLCMAVIIPSRKKFR